MIVSKWCYVSLRNSFFKISKKVLLWQSGDNRRTEHLTDSKFYKFTEPRKYIGDNVHKCIITIVNKN